MAQKVVLDPEGFEKVVAFVTDQKVTFNHLKRKLKDVSSNKISARKTSIGNQKESKSMPSLEQ